MPPSELYQTIVTVFRDQGWNFSEVSGREVVRAGFEGHHARVSLHVQAFPQLPAVSVVAESDRETQDPLRRERLAELAMRVNQQLTIGNFEMDWDSGRLSFRSTNVFASPQGAPHIIAGLVHNTIAEMDRMAPLESFIFQQEGPELAALDLPSLLERDDLVPEVPVPDESAG